MIRLAERKGALPRTLALQLLGAACVWAGVANAGEAVEGQKIAERWCVSCHAVSAKSTARDSAPPFGVLARDGVYDRERLLQLLTDPHPPMPRVHLSRDELDDVISYIHSLRPAN